MKESKMPGTSFDRSTELDEILNELLNYNSSSQNDSKLWVTDGKDGGLAGRQSGSITTQSGNSRTIISWQTSQAGSPINSSTLAKQFGGYDSSTRSGEVSDGLTLKPEVVSGSWKAREAFGAGSSTAKVVQYQGLTSDRISGTSKSDDGDKSLTELQSMESKQSTLGKTAKTPPQPPVRKRLPSADELEMGLMGNNSSGSKSSLKNEQRTGGLELTRNCASDSEETRSWLDEQIWKLQAKRCEKTYQHHTRLEKQLIADLKTRLGLAEDRNCTQSDSEERRAPILAHKTVRINGVPQGNEMFGGSYDDVTASLTASRSMRYVQSDTEDGILVTSPKEKTTLSHHSNSLGRQNNVVIKFGVNESADDVSKAASSVEVSRNIQDKRNIVRKEAVRSLSLGDADPGAAASRQTYKAQASFYVSGIERPAFSTHQTKYTFSVNPVKSDDSLNKGKPPPVPPPRSSAPTSPVIPKRGDSSREAVLRSQRKLVCSPTLDELENSLRLILEQPAANAPSTDTDKNVDRTNAISPVKGIEDELFVLRPIGPGVQTLEPDKARTLRSPMTPLTPVNGLQSTGETSAVSAGSIQQGLGLFNQQVNQQVSVQYATETIHATRGPEPLPSNMKQSVSSGSTTTTLPTQSFQQKKHLVRQCNERQLKQPYQECLCWQQEQLLQQIPCQHQQTWPLPEHLLQPSQPFQQQSLLQHTWPQLLHQHQQQQQQRQQQQLPIQPEVQKVYGALSYNQCPMPVEVETCTSEFSQQRVVQRPAVTEYTINNPSFLPIQNNRQLDAQRGTSLTRSQQNSQYGAPNVQRDIYQDDGTQQCNTSPPNAPLQNSQPCTLQQNNTLQHQPRNSQLIEGQTMSMQNAQMTRSQINGSQQLNVNQCGGQLMGPHQMNILQPGFYHSTPEFVPQQGIHTSGQYNCAEQHESSKYMVDEQTTSTLPRNGIQQPTGIQTQNSNLGTHHIPPQVETVSALKHRQQVYKQGLHQVQQQQAQQQQTYSQVLRSSIADQVQSGRSEVGGSITLDKATRSPPVGQSSGYNETLRSQTLQAKKTGTTAAQYSSYETLMRARSPVLKRAVSPAGVYNSQFGSGSLVFLADGADLANTMPRFVRDISKYWHKPNITREEAINLLKDKPPGSFVVRNSNTFQGGFGLALKVAQLPPNVLARGDDHQANLVRHFLIESSSKGVRLKGCSNEPVFGSLAALIYQHTITPLALPCKLVLPVECVSETDETDKGNADVLIQGSAVNALYVDSIDTESLTGPEALSRAVDIVIRKGNAAPKTTTVQLKVSYEGVTLTDNKHRLFFRRHYPLNTVTFCGIDGKDRRLNLTSEDNIIVSGKLFGFVARKSGGSCNNVCHLFLDPDNNQSASSVVGIVTKVMMGQGHFVSI